MSERQASEAANTEPSHVAGDDATPDVNPAEIIQTLLTQRGDWQHGRNPEDLPRYAYFLHRLVMAHMQRTTGKIPER